MLTEEQFHGLCAYVRGHLENAAPHSNQEWVRQFPRAAEQRWQHTLNVHRNAQKILAGEEADQVSVEVVRVAAIFHDVAMFDCDHAIHGQVGAELAEAYLFHQGFLEDFVRRVSRAIAEHGTDFGSLAPDEQGALLSWEGKVLVEADILDKLGASAVTGTLLYLGKEGLLAHECHTALSQGRAMERAAFFKDYFWTDTGRRLAGERFAFFLSYLEQLADEVVEVPASTQEA